MSDCVLPYLPIERSTFTPIFSSAPVLLKSALALSCHACAFASALMVSMRDETLPSAILRRHIQNSASECRFSSGTASA